MTRTKITQIRRQKVLEGCKHKCADCGATGYLEIHHNMPVAQGGKNDMENLVAVCMVCHVKRHGHTPKKLIKDEFWIKGRVL